MVGHSGVGKSTLVNRLVPDADRAVGVVSAIGKGRHTSTSAVALRARRRRRLDRRHARAYAPSASPTSSANNVLHGFPDLVEASANCPPNCDHTATSPICGLDALVAAGGADPRRLASFRRLLASQSGEAERTEGGDDELPALPPDYPFDVG